MIRWANIAVLRFTSAYARAGKVKQAYVIQDSLHDKKVANVRQRDRDGN